MKIAYWKDNNNFGDCLTPVLLDRLFHVKTEWSELEDAQFVGIGSIVEAIGPDFPGYIWGSGLMFKETNMLLHKAKVLALRGELTAKSLYLKTVLGEPGLLVKRISPDPAEKKHKLGVIPHWNDKELANGYAGLTIDITSGIDKVIAEAKSCERIISSSLHGLVLADAFGIPRKWIPSDRNPGGDFKFQDYQSLFGETLEPDVWYTSDPEKVNKICDRLVKAFTMNVL